MTASLSGSLGALNDTALGTFDALEYASVYVQITGTFVGTITLQVSNDGVNWFSKSLVNNTGGIAATATAPGIFSGDIGARYFRVAMTAYTSGSAAVDARFSYESQSNAITGGTAVSIGNVPSVLVSPVTGYGFMTTTNLGAGATYTGTTVDRGTTVSAGDTRVKPVVRHTAGLVHGHLTLEESTDGTTFYETRRSPIPSDGQFHAFDWPIHLRYWRLKFINGATAQTLFGLMYQSSKGDGSSNDLKTVLPFVLTQTALGVSGVFTSPTLDLGANHDWTMIRAFARGDQASSSGGFYIQASDDGTTWFGADQNAGLTTGVGTSHIIEARITTRYYRVVFNNATTAQTALRIWATLVSL